jgi:chromate reductase, NAD(P)H dehydrogenase (quinone)
MTINSLATRRREAFRILGIPGSLRRMSYNRLLLEAAQELCPAGTAIDLYELDSIPLYNADVDAAGPIAAVEEWKAAIRDADALLIATPEYNHSVPGVLKNAIDWASRPAFRSVLRHKPVAIMGAATGRLGTVRAQMELRQVLLSTHSYVLGQPEVLIASAAEQFDAEGRLASEATRTRIGDLLESLVEWTYRVAPPVAPVQEPVAIRRAA